MPKNSRSAPYFSWARARLGAERRHVPHQLANTSIRAGFDSRLSRLQRAGSPTAAATMGTSIAGASPPSVGPFFLFRCHRMSRPTNAASAQRVYDESVRELAIGDRPKLLSKRR